MYRLKNSAGIYQYLDMRLQYLREKSVLTVTTVKKKQLTTVWAKGRASKFCCMWCI